MNVHDSCSPSDSLIDSKPDAPVKNTDSDFSNFDNFNPITYRFFKKPMSSKFTILHSSALSISIKSNSITQEFLRRLTNTSPAEEQSIVNGILEEYVSELRYSG